MATLCLIAEPFPDWEAPVHFAAARDLAEAMAETAPRSCSTRFLIARGTESAVFSSPKIAIEHLPMRAGTLPLLWQSTTTARPLDGEMTHAITPLIPLRSRAEDDGTQSTVTVPHGIAWEQPELLTPSQGRLFRSFVRRAARHADIIITTSHATATLLQQRYGYDLPVQVIPPTAPTVFLAGSDAAARRARLGLPEKYLVTTAHDDNYGRLQWAYDALTTDPSLPHLVIIAGLDPVSQAKGAPPAAALESRVPDTIKHRVTVIPASVSAGPERSSRAEKNGRGGESSGGESSGGDGATDNRTTGNSVSQQLRCEDLADVGAIISGARILVQPQSFAATGYAVIAALMSSVPVLHAGTEPVTEFTIDGGLAEPESIGFVTALSRLFIPGSGDGKSELERLTVKAADRGRAFSWQSTAWQLWETHASL